MIKRGILGGLCAVLVCIAAFCAGCGYTFSGGGETEYLYDNAESYAVGGGSVGADISAIEADWISGEIKVAYADVSFAELEETNASREISEDEQLRYTVADGTLKIKYVKSGVWKFNKFSKSLTITLPYGVELEEFKVNSVSTDIYADTLTANKLNINCVSGSVSVVNLNAEDIIINSVSGNVKLGFDKLPCKAKLDMVSADFILYVPSGSVFGVAFSTVSGTLRSELEYQKSDNVYSFGGGEVVFDIDTVSGNVTVNG